MVYIRHVNVYTKRKEKEDENKKAVVEENTEKRP